MPLPTSLATAVPTDVEVLGVPVAKGTDGPELFGNGSGIDVEDLVARRFDGKVGETATVAVAGAPTVVAVGVGDTSEVGPDVLRRAAAALVRAAWKRGSAATTLLDATPPGVDRLAAARAVVEGAGLASYRFTRYKSDPEPCRLERLVLVSGEDGDTDTDVAAAV